MMKVIAELWEADEKNKLPVGTPVKVDFAWYYDLYGKYPEGHGTTGEVSDTWKDVDGFYCYNVKETGTGVVSGAYTRKDLKCL